MLHTWRTLCTKFFGRKIGDFMFDLDNAIVAKIFITTWQQSLLMMHKSSGPPDSDNVNAIWLPFDNFGISEDWAPYFPSARSIAVEWLSANTSTQCGGRCANYLTSAMAWNNLSTGYYCSMVAGSAVGNRVMPGLEPLMNLSAKVFMPRFVRFWYEWIKVIAPAISNLNAVFKLKVFLLVSVEFKRSAKTGPDRIFEQLPVPDHRNRIQS